MDTPRTGIDLSKILGGQTKIFGMQKVVKSDKCMGVFQLLGGTCPGCSPKSMPVTPRLPIPNQGVVTPTPPGLTPMLQVQ